MLRRAPSLVVAGIALVGCATAREEPRNNSDADVDAAMSPPMDAPRGMPDAPSSSGTCASPFTGVLATYSFVGATGSQVSTAASSTATGIVAGPILRSAGLTAVSGATSINSSNWPTAVTLDATKYYTLKLTPPTGCKLSLTGAAIDGKASGTGPASGAVATSADSFAATGIVSTAAPSTPALAVANATSAVEIRIYGYAATATGGTFRLQNTLTVSGSLQ